MIGNSMNYEVMAAAARWVSRALRCGVPDEYHENHVAVGDYLRFLEEHDPEGETELVSGEIMLCEPQGIFRMGSGLGLWHAFSQRFIRAGATSVDISQDEMIKLGSCTAIRPLIAVRGKQSGGNESYGGDSVHLVAELMRDEAYDPEPKQAFYAAAKIPCFWILRHGERSVIVLSDPKENYYRQRLVYGLKEKVPVSTAGAAFDLPVKSIYMEDVYSARRSEA